MFVFTGGAPGFFPDEPACRRVLSRGVALPMMSLPTLSVSLATAVLKKLKEDLVGMSVAAAAATEEVWSEAMLDS